MGVDAAKFDLAMREFAGNLRRLEKASNKTAGELLWKYSTRFVATLVAKTRPRGLGDKSALQRGEGAVERDIRKVYPSPGAVWDEVKAKIGDGGAGRFWALYRAGETWELQKLLRGIGYDCDVIAWDGGSRHEKEKFKLIRGGKKYFPRRRTIIINDKNVKSYIAKVQQHVMWAKAGWVSNFNPPGGVGNGGWPDSVKRHKTAPGRVVDKTRGLTSERAIIFENHVPYIAYLFSFAMAKSSLTFIGKVMAKDLEKAIAKIGNSQSAVA